MNSFDRETINSLKKLTSIAEELGCELSFESLGLMVRCIKRTAAGIVENKSFVSWQGLTSLTFPFETCEQTIRETANKVDKFIAEQEPTT